MKIKWKRDKDNLEVGERNIDWQGILRCHETHGLKSMKNLQ